MTDLELFARLIQCEAGGEGDNGMKAVASVVMNRVRTRLSGRTNLQNVYNMNPTNVHYEIAEWAIAGGRLANLWEALWFFNPYSSTCPNNFPSSVGYFQIRIGNHCFYNPAPSYANT